MIIIKKFGAVLAFHVLAFLLIYANPGCSSTKKAPLSADTTAVTPAPAAAPMINLAALPISLNPGGNPPPAPIGGFDPDAPAISGLERYSPKRPGPESAAPAPAVETPLAKTYTVAGGDSLWTIAKKNEISVAELSRANNLAASAMIHPGQKLVIPAKNAPAASVTPGSAPGATYRVKANENLAGIAKRAGVTAATLRDLNGLKTDALKVGQDLKLPPGVTVAAETPAAKPADNVFLHEVQPGETLETIARKYGLKQSEIGAANNIANPAVIRAGSKLVIPGLPSASKAAGPAPATTKAPAIQIPGAGQDLNSGLKTAPATAPAIRIDTPIIPIK